VERKLSEAIAAATWLTGADEAAVMLARGMAEQLDALISPKQQKMIGDTGGHASKVAYVAQTYRGILTELGLTPQGRRQLGIESGGEEDELASVIRGHFDTPTGD
jgi:hypothetical protein